MPESFIHPAYARLLYVLMNEHGLDVDALFAKAGLRWARLASDPSELNFKAFGSVVLAAQEALQCPWLGLEIGSFGQVSIHGSVGHAAISSATLRQALQTLVKYGPLRCDALSYSFSEQPGGGVFIISVPHAQGALRQFLHEAVFATLMRLLQAAVGPDFSKITVELPFASPPWAQRFKAYGLGQVRFDSAQLAVHFTAQDLNLNCITTDLQSHALALRECERALSARSGATVTQRVNHFLQSALGPRFEAPSLADAARHLHVSARTLIRKLKLEDTSYQTLLDDLRKDHAASHLSDTTETVEIIAHRLGYPDASNFSRTFRRWFGVTPGEFRKEASGTRVIGGAE